MHYVGLSRIRNSSALHILNLNENKISVNEKVQDEIRRLSSSSFLHKSVWTPVVDEMLECDMDTRAEAKEHDDNAVGVYRVKKELDEKKRALVGHVPIELSRLMKNFLEANSENKLFAQVTGKRKREVGLVVSAKFLAFTTELRIAKVLEKELIKGRAMKYTHFELKYIVIQPRIYFRG